MPLSQLSQCRHRCGWDSPSSSSTIRRRQSVESAYVRTISTADLAYSRWTSRRSLAALAMSAADRSRAARVADTLRSARERTAPTDSSSLTIAVTRAGDSPVEAARSLRETGPSSRIVCSTPVVSGTLGAAAGGEELRQRRGRWQVEQRRPGRLAVPAGPPDLLVVRVQRVGRLGVEHEPHVGLVHPHAERAGRDHHLDVAAHERVLGRLSVLAGQAAVVVHGVDAVVPQHRGQLLGPAVGRGVDDAGAARLDPAGAGRQRRVVRAGPAVDLLVVGLAVQREQHLPDHLVPLGRRRADQVDAEPDVGPVGVPDDDLAGRASAAARRSPRGPGARRSRSARAAGGEPSARAAEPSREVLRPEVVAPLADAVGLVDDEQRDPAPRVSAAEHLVVGQLLRREQQELELPGGEVGQRLLPRRAGTVVLSSAACSPVASSARSWSCCSAIVGETTSVPPSMSLAATV